VDYDEGHISIAQSDARLVEVPLGHVPDERIPIPTGEIALIFSVALLLEVRRSVGFTREHEARLHGVQERWQ
jgi:hypothetical protein